MESNRTTTALSAISLGLIGLCFALLLHEVLVTRKLWAEIPRLFGAFMAPVPFSVFIAYCFANRAGESPPELSPIKTSLFLALSIAVTIGIGVLIQVEPTDEPIGASPAITESAVFSASILNFLFFRSPLIAAALSGISIGLTFFVIFLTQS